MITATWDIPMMNPVAAHALVQLTDWHATIPADVFARACEHSLCLGLLVDEPTPGWPHPLVAFARVITDRATYAYLCDVIVHPAWRGRGLARRLVEESLAHPDLRSLRRFTLLSRDAAGLYRKYGWVDGDPDVTYLERRQALYHRGWVG
jgi:ribosomal protein S18 acetylase RimI-like enzyme